MWGLTLVDRNLNHSRLCHGTRVEVKRSINNVIEATSLTGKLTISIQAFADAYSCLF